MSLFMQIKSRIGLFLSGALILSGLWFIDELLTLAIYCQGCGYKIPLLGTWNLYDAEGIAWILILVGAIVGMTLDRS